MGRVFSLNLSYNGELGVPLELEQGTRGSSPVATWDLGLHSSCGWELRVPLDLCQEDRVALELQHGTQSSTLVVVGTQGSS